MKTQTIRKIKKRHFIFKHLIFKEDLTMLQQISTIFLACILLITIIGVMQAGAQTEEEQLTVMSAFADAILAQDEALILSYLTDDAVVQFEAGPPMSATEFVASIESFHQVFTDLSFTSFTEAFPLVSGNVGFNEHSAIRTHSGGEFAGVPPTGIDVEDFHMDIFDFEGDKIKKLTGHQDGADRLIQIGAIPAPELGNLVPSFTLSAPEPTGLSPLEAEAEVVERMNADNLPLLAKIIKEDADMRLPYIDRPASRDEFIAAYELLLQGFSDLHWETVRSIDMGGGWVVSERVLKGTNDGTFLGNPATGLPIEVRAGWVSHYDENGLATFLHLHLHGDSGMLEADLSLMREIRGIQNDEQDFRRLSIPEHILEGVDPTQSAMTQNIELFTKQSIGDRMFIDAILKDKPVFPSFYDGLKAQEVIDAAIESYQNGCLVSL